ncbi:MAG: hypothetical protein JST84_30340 [Acidobacteria bacterium]|nr:hypothetical protein [Acidobacteriota bacterium]
MRKTSFGTSLGVKGLSLAMILTSSFFPTQAGHTKNTIANAIAPGAIGIIQSTGAVTINGRSADGSFTLWGDEVVQVTTGAKIVFGALGEVNLSPGASVQLKMENAKLHEAAGTNAFSANLLAGEMSVALRNEAGALVNSVDSEFTASKGSSFKVDLKQGRAMILTGNGTVLANANSSSAKPFEGGTAATTTTKKDSQFLAAKKLEKLIGNFKLSVPPAVVTEAARRERAMDDLNQRRNAFMRSISLTSSNAFFADRSARPTNVTTASLARSIGAAESLHGMLVNGRLTSGREMLWGGEIVEAPRGSGARLAFTSIGQVVLNSGAKAKLTTEVVGATTSLQSTQKVLAAQLLSGDLQVRFDPQASGYVRAGDAVMAATRGANFRVEMREGNGAVDVMNGSVMVIGNWPLLAPPVIKDVDGKTRFDVKSYHIRPANLSGTINIGTKQSYPIQMRVTDQNNRPVADVPVRFSVQGTGTLGNVVIGLTSTEVRTDARGIASVPYNAASVVGSSTVTAEIPGTNATTTTTANVTTQQPSFNSWQGGLPAIITLAAAIGIGASLYATRGNRSPTITGKGDALIVP